uniref:Photosystem I assembly protein Ycf4 n=1 Tax=Nephroselmis pyriformis TaxID=156128 RepID=A0A8A2H7L9_9CHLO|nr:hypothetical chloroplast RF4 [Nephroselmis pyriformis]QSV37256.1 hypothetical chloroplast RF4 [Nephroselmis pyriformis]
MPNYTIFESVLESRHVYRNASYVNLRSSNHVDPVLPGRALPSLRFIRSKKCMVNSFDSSVRRDPIVGSRRSSNYCWALILSIGGLGFLLVSLSSRLGINLLPMISAQEITFLPQGLVMGFYGTMGLLLSLYLWLTILWDVGGGFNEFDKQKGRIRIFRWGFPGKNRRIDLTSPLTDVEAIRMDIQEGVNPKRTLYVRLKGRREVPLTRIGQPLTLAELERQGAELAGFLQVPLEGL